MTLQEHEAKKPVRTKELKDMTQAEYQQWSCAMSEWLWERDAIAAPGYVISMETPKDLRERMMREKACTPRATYQYRDIPKRKPRRPRGVAA